MTSKSSDNPSTHPIQPSECSSGMADVNPGAEHNASFFRQHGLGPGEIAARITGVVAIEEREDDGSCLTSNEGIPYPDPAHRKNVGGIPVASDQFLSQKLQVFNRSKTQERRKLPYSTPFLFSCHFLISTTG